MHDAGDDQAEGNGDEAEKYDQAKRIEDCAQEIGVLQDSDVVGKAHPRHGADSIPAKEGILDAHQEGEEHKKGVHD